MKILVLDDEQAVAEPLVELLNIKGQQAGILVVTHSVTMDQIIAEIRLDGIQAVIVDYRMPPFTGLQLLSCLSQEFPGLKLILHSGEMSYDMAQEAIAYGAVPLSKPCKIQTILSALEGVFEPID
ncbi:response regulator [Patescibacteria group bacterium]|nr:response regulator [Patescibacteria group bacterium]